MSSTLARGSMAVAMLVTMLGCVSDARVVRPPRFPLADGRFYVSAMDAETAVAVRGALANAGLTITDEPQQTRLVVIPIDGKAQLGFDTGSCGHLRNRRWDVYASVPETESRQSTTFQEGAFSKTEKRTFALDSLVLQIVSKTYDRSCGAHPESAYDRMARELARFLPARRPL